MNYTLRDHATLIATKYRNHGFPNARINPDSLREWSIKITLGDDYPGNLIISGNAKGKTKLLLHELKTDSTNKDKILKIWNQPDLRPESDSPLPIPTESSDKSKAVPHTTTPIAYVDGSGGKNNTTCTYGIAIYKEGKEIAILSGNLGPQPTQQILGECEAVIRTMLWAKEQGITNIKIHHDLEGSAHWANQTWKRNKPETRAYSMRAQELKKHVTAHFQWVKAHEGNLGNERADELAGQAEHLPIEASIIFKKDKKSVSHITPSIPIKKTEISTPAELISETAEEIHQSILNGKSNKAELHAILKNRLQSAITIPIALQDV
jgi:ribonuclease HI